jgi:hypothetical protein
LSNIARRSMSRARNGASWAAEHVLATAGVNRPRIALILGHMRSGSTLLLHLLQSHPEVAALGERNRTYVHGSDFSRLVIDTRLAQQRPLRPLAYVADQINHNRFTPVAQLLTQRRVRVLFLLRRPSPTIASLLELSRRYYSDSWTPTRAVDYYCERLAGLERLAASLRRRQAAFLTYETLTTQPEPLLQRLSAFLRLTPSLGTDYPQQRYTRASGDPGTRIRAGRVLPAEDLEADIEPALLARAAAAHEACHAALAAFAPGESQDTPRGRKA